ncbi:guanylate kinase [Vallitalea okinawensis]|uniref:guanylate kinase n=1 Tax=Vallitalea okinawensis TaxID=2078660 RepID=UPI000CFC7160|nr:guanylate kinase [Vallitalea okinawensis]
MNSHKGLLIVISGFSGAGKGTVVKELVEQYDYALSISATTRQPRMNERNGEHYFFIDKEDFEEKIKKEKFFEWAEYCNHYYGTPKDFVYERINEGKDVILEIEVQGAFKILEQCPEAILIFVTAPSINELKKRLIGRGTETSEVVQKRIQRAYEEVDMIKDYDYIVINEDVKQCAKDIHTIVVSEHMHVKNAMELPERLKEQFMTVLSE